MSRYDFTTVPERAGMGSAKLAWAGRPEYPVPSGTVTFGMADMEFDLAPEIRAALVRSAHEDIYFYPCATPEYCSAVRGWMERRHGWNVKDEWILQSTGVVAALFAAVEAFTAPDEGVVFLTPAYQPFYDAAASGGRRGVQCPLLCDDELRYTIDFDLLERLCACPENTLLLFCSPHNPTCRVWSEDEVRRVGDICARNGVTVVSDEIHFDIIAPGVRHTVFAKAAPECRWVVCTAPSKSFNIAGLSTSNLICADAGMRAALAAKLHSEPPLTGYRACIAAYDRAEAWLDECVGVIWKNYDILRGFLSRRLPMLRLTPPEGTYLAWVDARALGVGEEALLDGLAAHGVFVNGGGMYGDRCNGFVRVNLACPTAVLEDMLPRFAAAVEGLCQTQRNG